MDIINKINMLLEASRVINKIETPITPEEAEELIKTKCVKNFEQGQIIVRGNKALGRQAYLFTGTKTRESANTFNWYTLLFSKYLTSWSKFPKRDHSLICTTSVEKAQVYGGKNHIFRVIPFDSTNIFGAAEKEDIWDITENNLYCREIAPGGSLDGICLNLFSYFDNRWGGFENWLNKSMKEVWDFIVQRKDEDRIKWYIILMLWYDGKSPQEAKTLSEKYPNIDIPENILKAPFLTILNKCLAPNQTTAKLITNYSDLKRYRDSEVWLDKPALMIRSDSKLLKL